jgi:hypothetical protein
MTVQRFDSSTDVITVVCTDPTEPRLATILSALRRELVQSQSEGKIKLRIFKLEGSPESMKPRPSSLFSLFLLVSRAVRVA